MLAALHTMDALEKLAANNRLHKKHKRAERIAAFILFIGALPAYIDWVYSSVYFFEDFPKNIIPMIGSCIGALCFSLPLMAMGDLLILPKWFKIIVFILLQVWFTYFWVFYNLSWPAFLVLIPVYILLQFQVPEIKRRAKEADGI
jgi:hypothetical protein